jgi:hypothetical protein
MYHLHLSRNLRSLGFLTVAVLAIAALSALWWANRTGLPESWRSLIERELGRQGIHMRIGGLSYLPLRGVAATHVRAFADAAHRQEIARFERVLLDFDKTKLSRGIVHLNKIELRRATLSLPVDPNDPDGETLLVNEASGTLFMPGGRRLEIRDASGRIAGIRIALNARLTGRSSDSESPAERSDAGKRRKLLAQVIRELAAWRFDPDREPRLSVFLEGEAGRGDSLAAKVTLQAWNPEKNRHALEELHADADIRNGLVTLTSLRARDARGVLDARLDYHLGQRGGRFDLQSTLELEPLLKAWFGLPQLNHIVIGGGLEINSLGEFQLRESGPPALRMTGNAKARSVMLRGVRFDAVESAFAWRDGDLLLRDLALRRGDGRITGKAMIQWPMVRLAVHGTVPGQVYKPFFAGQPLEKVIDDFTDRSGASYDISLEGGFDVTDRHSWAYTGSGTVKNVSYKGVPVDLARCRMSLNHHELDFYNGSVTFNYRDYPLRQAFSGPARGIAKVGRIRYVGASKVVEIEDVTGPVWAAPLVRMFAPAVADSLEVYRFHRPPQLNGSGVVDVTPQGRTDLGVAFSSPDAADYRFLGENITLGQPSGMVRIRGPRVTIGGLRVNAFDGPVAADFEFADGRLSGELSWTRLALPALNSTYGFQMKGGGTVTGRLEFALEGGRVETMNGKGLFALEKTELFSVPIFGPLSQVISGVLNDRRAGFERAKDAFCNFTIKDGVLRTADFQTATTSLTFVGEGEVDLARRTIDMIMRMNARGLLGLITLPLRPFYGMFQFRGTGPLKNPQWENVMFTTPSTQQRELLQAAPKARAVEAQN